MVALNIGRSTKIERSKTNINCNVVIQGTDYEELGSSLGTSVLPPDKELLDALKSGNEGFLLWFKSRVVCFMTIRGADGAEEHSVLRNDGKKVVAPKNVN